MRHLLPPAVAKPGKNEYLGNLYRGQKKKKILLRSPHQEPINYQIILNKSGVFFTADTDASMT